MLTAAEKRAIRDKAADLIEQKGWCQGAYARLADGSDVGEHHPDAVAFCLLGAVRRTRAGHGPACGVITDAFMAGLWNDAPGRTAAEVVAFLRSDKERPE